jgi:hypothetical protein
MKMLIVSMTTMMRSQFEMDDEAETKARAERQQRGNKLERENTVQKAAGR